VYRNGLHPHARKDAESPKWGLRVKALLTGKGREGCGTDAQFYEVLLAANDVKRRRIGLPPSRTYAFGEGFNLSVPEQFFRKDFRKEVYEALPSLQPNLERWLGFSNKKRIHQGYRNKGRRLLPRVDLFPSTAQAEGSLCERNGRRKVFPKQEDDRVLSEESTGAGP